LKYQKNASIICVHGPMFLSCTGPLTCQGQPWLHSQASGTYDLSRFNANQKFGFDFVSFPSHTLRGRLFGSGCKCSLYFKYNLNIFWIVNFFWKKCCMYIFITYAWAKLFHENPTFRGLGKKDKIQWYNKGLHEIFFFFFTHNNTNIDLSWNLVMRT
jgi:hypothetical protein